MTDWISPLYSRSQVKRSGVILRNSETPFEEIEAISVLNNWKAAHELPLHYIMKTIREYTKDVSDASTIVQRRKRTESILLKLNQQPKLDLARMQDLVGFRVVFRHDNHERNLACIKELEQKILSSSMQSKVTRLTNYIDKPRKSGYRSVHAIFKYDSPKYPSHNKMQVELQIRTKMQHIWATAVETVGMFKKSNLKQELGDENWLEFFRLMSFRMAINEGASSASSNDIDNLRNKLTQLSEEIEFKNTMKLISIQHKILETAYKKIRLKTKSSVGYMLLKLDLTPMKEADEPTIDIKSFSKDKEAEATELYGQLEEEAYDNPMCYVLLAKSEDVNNLRRGFPNYFADVTEFIQLHEQYCSKDIEQ